MERTIRAWIGNDYVEFEAELPTNMTEDEFYEEIVEYIYSNLSVEIL